MARAPRRRGRRRRSRHVPNFYTAAAINPKRKRRRTHRRRSYRHTVMATNPRRRRSHRRYHTNPPDILGFNLKDVAMAGAAVVVAPFIERQLIGLLPASLAGGRTGRWLVKVGTAAATGFAAKKLLGPKAGNLALIALGANLIAEAVSEFAPQLTGVGYYPALSGAGLGAFPTAGQRPMLLGSDRLFTEFDKATVDRLNPAMRY